MKSYREKNYEQALVETFLKFDEMLRDHNVNRFLLEHDRTNSQDVVLDYTLNAEFKSDTLDEANLQLICDNISTAPKSKPPSEDSKGGHHEIPLTLENSRLEYSLKKLAELSYISSEELIASNMGTTANILLIKNNYLYIANVGDSLAVLYKNGEAIKLNQEHKTSLESEYSRINKSGTKIINNRIDGRLNLTRAIGKGF
jgi:serine/threonine protein phosphatase PrpC